MLLGGACMHEAPLLHTVIKRQAKLYSYTSRWRRSGRWLVCAAVPCAQSRWRGPPVAAHAAS